MKPTPDTVSGTPAQPSCRERMSRGPVGLGAEVSLKTNTSLPSRNPT